MTRPAAHKVPSAPPELRRADQVVRTAKAIPVMTRPEPVVEAVDAAEPPRANICMGRCGHCDVHPCQLHTPV